MIVLWIIFDWVLHTHPIPFLRLHLFFTVMSEMAKFSQGKILSNNRKVNYKRQYFWLQVPYQSMKLSSLKNKTKKHVYIVVCSGRDSLMCSYNIWLPSWCSTSAMAAVCKYSSHQQSWRWRGPAVSSMGQSVKCAEYPILLTGLQTDGGFGERAGSSLQGCRG